MLICRNAEGVHGQRKVYNPWRRSLNVPVSVPSALYQNSVNSGFCPDHN